MRYINARLQEAVYIRSIAKDDDSIRQKTRDELHDEVENILEECLNAYKYDPTDR